MIDLGSIVVDKYYSKEKVLPEDNNKRIIIGSDIKHLTNNLPKNLSDFSKSEYYSIIFDTENKTFSLESNLSEKIVIAIDTMFLWNDDIPIYIDDNNIWYFGDIKLKPIGHDYLRDFILFERID